MYGQQQEPHEKMLPDSLFYKSYDELARNFDAFKADFSRAETYAKAYLKKSIIDRDTLKQANAYYFLSSIHQPSISEKYADSIIALTKDNEDYRIDSYPFKGFLAKMFALRRMEKYEEAIHQLQEAYHYTIPDNAAASQQYRMVITYRIGLLKNEMGDYKAALAIFRTYLNDVMKAMYTEPGGQYYIKPGQEAHYMRALFALGDAYYRNKKYDSAAIMNKKGIKFYLNKNRSQKAMYLKLYAGIDAYSEKNYSASLDSLNNVASTLVATDDLENLLTYMYMGKAFKNQGKIKDAILYFRKADSIVAKTSYTFPFIREVYESLMNYHSSKGDLKEQLKYKKQLVTLDSILMRHYAYLKRNIGRKNSNPLLALFNAGMAAYRERNYSMALDSFRKALKVFTSVGDYEYLMYCYLYMGKIAMDQGKMNEAVLYFKKADAIVAENADAFIKVREAYEALVNYYEERESLENQLKYTKRLLYADSLILRKLRMSDDVRPYYSPYYSLINNKEENGKTIRLKTIIILTLAVIMVFISVFAYYYYRKQYMYRIRIRALLNKKHIEKSDPTVKKQYKDIKK